MEQLTWDFDNAKISKPIRLIELFAGYGSQAMALRNIGADFEKYKAIEIDKYAVKSYNAVHGTDIIPTDICKIEDLGIVDKEKYEYILFFSFPCTDVSYAGLQQGFEEGSGTASSLLWEVKRLLLNNPLPQTLIMENVKALVGKKNMPLFQKWLDFLNSLGYKTTWQVLNTKDYGVPQNRERVFAISFLDHNRNYEFPKPVPLKNTLRELLEDTVDESFYMQSEKAEKLINELLERYTIEDFLIAADVNGCVPVDKSVNKPRINKISNCITAREDRGISNHANEGNGVLIINDKIKQISGLPTEQRLEPKTDGCVNTITSIQKDSMILSLDFRLRKLTPRECLRLQGVSDEDIDKMEKVNSKTQLYKQAENSITVNVLEAIFKQLIKGA